MQLTVPRGLVGRTPNLTSDPASKGFVGFPDVSIPRMFALLDKESCLHCRGHMNGLANFERFVEGAFWSALNTGEWKAIAPSFVEDPRLITFARESMHAVFDPKSMHPTVSYPQYPQGTISQTAIPGEVKTVSFELFQRFGNGKRVDGTATMVWRSKRSQWVMLSFALE